MTELCLNQHSMKTHRLVPCSQDMDTISERRPGKEEEIQRCWGGGIAFRSTVTEVSVSSAGFPLLLFFLMHTDSYSMRKVTEEQLGLGASGINAPCHFGDGV